jgi:hypothetical protein
METIVNKVAESGIITLDLTHYIPTDAQIIAFDLKPFLFREMILKEKDYRALLLEHDWKQYEGKYVAVFCSVDAIIPVWAYMLAASYLQPLAADVLFVKEEEIKERIALKKIETIDTTEYADKRVVIKGCGDVHVPDSLYLSITRLLRPVVKSLMYGEPCSTVPIYKKK